MGQAWCVASPGAKLALAVPTSVHSGEDVIEYNAHRVYGPGLYPFLATNWQFSWPMEGRQKTKLVNLIFFIIFLQI